ncbi:hypothetical protein F5Y12DRAFT_792100 [Xylaria sp. FL1777]|nr:hypothetical protein F5Y12DRAFT_792100 [Xylaria sp. FL1777]
MGQPPFESQLSSLPEINYSAEKTEHQGLIPVFPEMFPPPSPGTPERINGDTRPNSPSLYPELQSEAPYSFTTSISMSPRNWQGTETGVSTFSWDDAAYSFQACDVGSFTAPYNFYPRQMPTSDYLSIDNESSGVKSEITSSFPIEADDIPEAPAPKDNSEGESAVKPNMPYAQYIWMALMSIDSHSMSLPQIYQWFRDNTDKTSSQSKGWQNSIRHNLSMNAAFTKGESKSSDTKKSSEWVLEAWAIRNGVQSTTRYRKGNPTRRGGSTNHRSNGNISVRASSGRRGGVNTKNKTIGTRRAMLNRTANLALSNRQIETVNKPIVHNRPSYNYLPSTVTAVNPSNQADWIMRPVPSVAALPTQYNYNEPILHQGLGNFFPNEQIQNLFIHPQEPIDDGTNSFIWDSTSSGSTYA